MKHEISHVSLIATFVCDFLRRTEIGIYLISSAVLVYQRESKLGY